MQRSASILLLTLMAAAPSAQAALVTWRASGTISQVVDPTGAFGGQIAAGSTFTLDYTFDTSTLDGFAGPSWGSYVNAITSVSLAFAGSVGTLQHSFSSLGSTGNISVNDGTPSGAMFLDTFNLQAMSPYQATGVRDNVTMNLYNSASTIAVGPFASDSMPSSPPDPLDFYLLRTFRWEEVFLSNGSVLNTSFVSGTVTSHSVSPVPLPAAVWLLLSGLGGLGMLSRGRNALGVPGLNS